MKDISSPTVIVMLLSFFTDTRSLAEMNQRKGSVQLPTHKLSGPLRCSQASRTTARGWQIWQRIHQKPTALGVVPRGLAGQALHARIQATKSCLYEFNLLLQWREILEVIVLPEQVSGAVGCPTWLLAVHLQVKVSWMLWVMSPIVSGTLKVSQIALGACV